MSTINYDPNIGIPLEKYRDLTIVDDTCHVKVWRDSDTGQVTVCIDPKWGEVQPLQVIQVRVTTLPPALGGTAPCHYIRIKRGEVPDQLTRNGKAIHGHEYYHPPVSERTPSNWCGICKDWFVPDIFRKDLMKQPKKAQQ